MINLQSEEMKEKINKELFLKLRKYTGGYKITEEQKTRKEIIQTFLNEYFKVINLEEKYYEIYKKEKVFFLAGESVNSLIKFITGEEKTFIFNDLDIFILNIKIPLQKYNSNTDDENNFYNNLDKNYKLIESIKKNYYYEIYNFISIEHPIFSDYSFFGNPNRFQYYARAVLENFDISSTQIGLLFNFELNDFEIIYTDEYLNFIKNKEIIANKNKPFHPNTFFRLFRKYKETIKIDPNEGYSTKYYLNKDLVFNTINTFGYYSKILEDIKINLIHTLDHHDEILNSIRSKNINFWNFKNIVKKSNTVGYLPYNTIKSFNELKILTSIYNPLYQSIHTRFSQLEDLVLIRNNGLIFKYNPTKPILQNELYKIPLEYLYKISKIPLDKLSDNSKLAYMDSFEYFLRHSYSFAGFEYQGYFLSSKKLNLKILFLINKIFKYKYKNLNQVYKCIDEKLEKNIFPEKEMQYIILYFKYLKLFIKNPFLLKYNNDELKIIFKIVEEHLHLSTINYNGVYVEFICKLLLETYYIDKYIENNDKNIREYIKLSIYAKIEKIVSPRGSDLFKFVDPFDSEKYQENIEYILKKYIKELEEEYYKENIALTDFDPIKIKFNDIIVEELNKGADLKLEGKRMNHCVGGYSYQVSNFRSIIFKIQSKTNSKFRYTLEIIPSLDEKNLIIYKVNQLYGKRNRSPLQEHSTQLDSIIDTIKEQLESRKKIYHEKLKGATNAYDFRGFAI